MKKFLLAPVVIFSCFCSAMAQTSEVWQQKVDAVLFEKTRDHQDAPFIVFLTQQADIRAAAHLKTKDEKAAYVFQSLRHTANATQPDIASFLQQKNIRHKRLYVVNAIRVEGGNAILESLARRQDVARILYDPVTRFAQPVEWSHIDESPRASVTWGIEMIHADEAWDMGYRGQGIVVGGQDTGYEWDHPALKKQYRGYDAEADAVDHNFNWHDAIHEIHPLNNDSINPCGLDSPVPCDDHGHGTHTMGTMIGLDEENNEVIGVAPEARWCACRNMERGWGTLFTYLECFQWFLAPTDLNRENPDPSKAPHVINNSWGCPESEGCDSTNWEILDIAVNNLRAAGTVVVVSAGNSGSNCASVSTPAAIHEGSFSVGATAENDTIAGFSSRGPVEVDGSFRLKPNVSAPGVRVRSARLNGNYGNSSGTSMAGPHVAGLVALMISANPDLAGQVGTIETIIEQTAVAKTTDQFCGDIPGEEVPNHTYGFGRIDALAAVRAALDLLPTGTHDEQVPVVAVFPNPVYDRLSIRLSDTWSAVQAEVFDLQGKTVSRQKQEGGRTLIQIDLSGLPAGVYFFNVTTTRFLYQGKVVKM